MREDVSTIEVLQNNAKAFGGVVGAEYAYLEKRPEIDANDYFHDKKTLNL